MSEKPILNVQNVKNAKNGTKNFMYFLRENIRDYMAQNDLTADEMAEKAGISEHTLHSILYKAGEDCKLYTAIALAKTMGIGVDELANTGAMTDDALEAFKTVRKLPQNIQVLIKRYIKWQQCMHEKYKDTRSKIIDVMNLDYENDHLVTTNDFEKVDISEFSEDIKAKVFGGVRIPCEEYAEFYNENDILLLCDERKPRNRERAVILYYNRVYIVQKTVQDGVSGYRGIRSTTAFIPETDISNYFGYVAGVKHD